MAEVTSRSIVQRRTDVIDNSLSDCESVMLDVERGRYFGLKDAGHEIWRMLETPTSVDDLCGELCERFDVDPATCRADVLVFLADLAQHDLIDVVDPPASS